MYKLSVVRLWNEPAVAPYELIDRCTLNDNSHLTLLQNNSTCSPLKHNAHVAHAHQSKDMCTDSSFGSSRPISAFSQWYFQILLYMAVQTLNTALLDSTSTFHHECHRLLAISQRILNMECCSSSIAVLDSWSWSSCFQ